MEVSERRSAARKMLSLKAVFVGVSAGILVLLLLAVVSSALINSEKIGVAVQDIVCLAISSAAFLVASLFTSLVSENRRFAAALLSCVVMESIMFVLGFCFRGASVSVPYLIYVLLLSLICALLGCAFGAAMRKNR